MLPLSPVRIFGAILVAASLGALAGCVSHSPASPSPTASTPAPTSSSSIPLTVHVVTRGVEQPISGATVFQDNRLVGETGRDGAVLTEVPLGVEFHIAVTADGYVSLGASGTVRSAEQWTFYLERAP